MLTSLALVWFTRRARMRVTICVFIHTHTGTLARSQHYCWPVQTIRSAFSFQTPSALSQEPQGALAWLPHMYSDLAQGTLVISPNQISPRGQRSGCWGNTKGSSVPQTAAPKEVLQPVCGWLRPGARPVPGRVQVLLGGREA